MRADLKIALFIAAICFVGGLFVLPYQLNTMQTLLPEQFETTIATMTLPYPLLIVLTSVQLSVLTFILALIGIKLARKTSFTLPILDAIFQKKKVRI